MNTNVSLKSQNNNVPKIENENIDTINDCSRVNPARKPVIPSEKAHTSNNNAFFFMLLANDCTSHPNE